MDHPNTYGMMGYDFKTHIGWQFLVYEGPKMAKISFLLVFGPFLHAETTSRYLPGSF